MGSKVQLAKTAGRIQALVLKILISSQDFLDKENFDVRLHLSLAIDSSSRADFRPKENLNPSLFQQPREGDGVGGLTQCFSICG